MTRVVVIGGGVIGAACGLELARRGAEVTVLDRGRVGHGCSYGNAGWLTPSQAFPLAAPGVVAKALRWMPRADSPFSIRLRADPALALWLARFALASRRSRFERGTAALVEICEWSVDAWEAMAEREGASFGFARAGLVAVFETEGGLREGLERAELVASLGIPHERWSAEELREREPAVTGRQCGGVFYPRDAHCLPYEAMCAIAEEARRAGVRFVEGAGVSGAERRSGRIEAVRTSQGVFEGDEFVLAAGVWSRRVGRHLGVRVPVVGAKGYSLTAPALDPHPRRSLLLAERKVAVNPRADSLRISGTLELSSGEDHSINRRRVEGIVRGARAVLAMRAEPDPSRVWCGLRPCTPDGLPLLGRARGNVWLATGHQMTGLKTAPASGRLVAELMSGERATFDPEPFRADRF